jgi:hypothetical protein
MLALAGPEVKLRKKRNEKAGLPIPGFSKKKGGEKEVPSIVV